MAVVALRELALVLARLRLNRRVLAHRNIAHSAGNSR
jgi:hypothetical protein